MASLEITRFVEASLAQGLSKTEIAQALEDRWVVREGNSVSPPDLFRCEVSRSRAEKKSLQLAPGGIFLSNPIHFSLYLDLDFGCSPFSIF